MKKKLCIFALFTIILSLIILRFFMPEKVINTAICLAESDNAPKIKTVYLTFDDGPSDRVTPLILDVLKRNNVKATFFIIGRQAETRPYLLQREIDEGHTVAVHSYTHDYSQIYKSGDALEKDINKCNQVIEKITGKKSHLYRFPGGSFSVKKQFKEKVKEMGFKHVDWNASCGDAEIKNPTPQQLFNRSISTAKNASSVVLLAHDSTTRVSTAYALDGIIKHFKNRGYLFDVL